MALQKQESGTSAHSAVLALTVSTLTKVDAEQSRVNAVVSFVGGVYTSSYISMLP